MISILVDHRTLHHRTYSNGPTKFEYQLLLPNSNVTTAKNVQWRQRERRQSTDKYKLNCAVEMENVLQINNCFLCFYTCNSMLCSKLYALGLPSRVENATFPSRNGEISLYSLVQNARDSDSPLLAPSGKSGKPYVSRHVALLIPIINHDVCELTM